MTRAETEELLDGFTEKEIRDFIYWLWKKGAPCSPTTINRFKANVLPWIHKGESVERL